MNVFCCSPFYLWYGLTEYSVVGTALGPAFPVDMPGTGLITLRHCFHPATSTCPLMSDSSTAVVMCLDSLWESMPLIVGDMESGRTLSAAAAAKSLQLCPTLCNPIDGSPPDFPVPGILQARSLEWLPFPPPMHESEKGN